MKSAGILKGVVGEENLLGAGEEDGVGQVKRGEGVRGRWSTGGGGIKGGSYGARAGTPGSGASDQRQWAAVFGRPISAVQGELNSRPIPGFRGEEPMPIPNAGDTGLLPVVWG